MHWLHSECIFCKPSLITLYQFWILSNTRQVNKFKCINPSTNRDAQTKQSCSFVLGVNAVLIRQAQGSQLVSPAKSTHNWF